MSKAKKQMPRKKVAIYTDASVIDYTDAGVGVVLVYKPSIDKTYTKQWFMPIGESEVDRAELLAIIYGIMLLKEPCVVNIYCDSRTTVAVAKKNGKEKDNAEVWQKLRALEKIHTIHYHWIRRDRHAYNKQAHALARQAAESQALIACTVAKFLL